jgi:hypothetical protein
MNINLTFNETTYNFNLCLGKADKKGNAYLYYNIYINGERNHDYSLEEGTISGSNDGKLPSGNERIFILYWKSFASSVHITNPNDLEEIVKVITYINKHK